MKLIHAHDPSRFPRQHAGFPFTVNDISVATALACYHPEPVRSPSIVSTALPWPITIPPSIPQLTSFVAVSIS
jgi:hypothetical protein